MRGTRNKSGIQYKRDVAAAIIGGSAPSGPPAAPDEVGGYLTFVDGTIITTPYTAEMAQTGDVDLYVQETRSDWADNSNSGFLVVNANSGGAGQSLQHQGTSHAFQWLGQSFNRGQTIQMSGHPGGTSHRHRGTYDAAAGQWTTQIDDDAPVPGDIHEPGEVGQPNAATPFAIGGDRGTGFGGLAAAGIHAAAFGDGKAWLVTFSAEDVGLPAGAVASGHTFTSGGRLWTVSGTGIEYVAPAPAVLAAKATKPQILAWLLAQGVVIANAQTLTKAELWVLVNNYLSNP